MIAFQPGRSAFRRVGIIGCVLAVIIAVIILGSFAFGVAVACEAASGTPGPLADLLGLDGDVETREVPGDARAFDPFAALPDVAAFAGPGAQLVAIDVALVRANGTLDLKAPFTPKPAVTYTFAREVPRPADAPPPGAGGANTGPWYETVKIRAYEPGQRRRRTTVGDGVGRTVQYTNKGLDKETEKASAVPVKLVQAPVCKLADLWTVALQRGAPADAVARVVYDADGYEFSITGLRISIAFDAGCTPKPTR